LNHEGHEEHEGLQDEAFDPVLQLCDIEIDKQTKRNFRESHIRKNLSLVVREERFNAFDLVDQFTPREQIDSIAAIE